MSQNGSFNIGSITNTGLVDSLGNTISHLNPNHGTSVSLLVFPPQLINDQVLRTNRYNFSQEFVESINSPNPDRFTNNLDMAPDSVKTAIVPTFEHEVVDVNPFRDYWSFILLLDTQGTAGSILEAGGPNTRTTMVGYFTSEPMANVHSTSPLVNYEAYMVVTHMDSAKLQTVYGQNGAYNTGGMLSSSDMVHMLYGQSYAPVMGMTDVTSLAHGHGTPGYANGSLVPNGNPLQLSDMVRQGSHISDTTKAPLEQLRILTSAAQATHNVCGGADISKFYDTTVEQAAQTAMMGSLQKKSIYFDFANVIDPKVPFQLKMLDAAFPGMSAQYCDIAPPSPMEVLNPHENTTTSIYASMVSNTTASYARKNMLANISFRYDSWTAGGGEPLWFIEPTVSTIIHSDNPSKLTSDVNAFKLLMERGLFPILQQALGHFYLIVTYDGSGDTHVNLNSMNMDIKTVGSYVYHNRLGGLINPSLGNHDMYSSNTNQFAGLVGAVVADVTGAYEAEDNFGTHMDGSDFIL